MGCNVYIRTDSHEKMIQRGHDPAEYVNQKVEEALKKEEAEGAKG